MSTLDTRFIDALASASPTPGGGGASAYVGAVAAALASMVGELTLGKKKYAAVEGEVETSLARLGELRSLLISLVDADAQAFAPLAAAYAMPAQEATDREAKQAAIQASLAGACEVPLAIMQACVSVIGECTFMAKHGSRLAISDAGACAVLAKAAAIGASYNVFINAAAMENTAEAEALKKQATGLAEEASRMADEISTFVAAEIGAPL